MDIEPTLPLVEVATPQIESAIQPKSASGASLRYTLFSVAAVAVLVIAVLVVYWRQLSPVLWGQSAPANPELTYIADLDFWKRTPRETKVVATAHFDLNHDLNNVPLEVGDWKGKDVPETNQEVMILLQPEQYIQRLYQNSDGQYMWLTMVGGRSSQPFHAPDICYDADGWQYNLGSHAVQLPQGGEVHGLYLEAEKTYPGDAQPTKHVVSYFYLFPNEQRDLADGIVLFKLTSFLIDGVEQTLEMHADFVQQYFVSAQAGNS
jgi:hypothetical protein